MTPDREDLIRALGTAFSDKDSANAESRIETQSVRMENHNYARAQIKEAEGEKAAFLAYPTSTIVKNFCNFLKGTHEAAGEQSSDVLMQKFIEAAIAGDDRRVEELTTLAMNYSTRFNVVGNAVAQRSLLLIQAADAINKA